MTLSELTKRLKLTDDAETERMMVMLAEDVEAFTEVGLRVNKMRAYRRRLTMDGQMVERTFKVGKNGDGLIAIPDEFDLKV